MNYNTENNNIINNNPSIVKNETSYVKSSDFENNHKNLLKGYDDYSKKKKQVVRKKVDADDI